MTDTLTPAQRHLVMSHIRSRNTKPEIKVRQWLWNHGYRYRLNVKGVPGKPDIVMRKYHTAIFVNGCFWHGHGVAIPPVNSEELRVKGENPVRGSISVARGFNPGETENEKCCKIPQTNREFWVNKIHRNQQRDQQNYQLLIDNGWQVIVIWECQLKAHLIDRTMYEVELLLNEKLLSLYQKHKPVIYRQNREEADLPMAAETIEYRNE